MIKEDPKTTILVAYLMAFLGQVCELGFNILVFRQFSLDDVGTYALIMSIVVFVGFALDMGVTQTLIRGFSQNTLSLSQGLVGSLVIRLPVLVLGGGVLLVWLLTSKSLTYGQWLPLTLAILWQVILGFRAIPTSWLRAHDRQKTANTLTFLLPFGRLATGLSLVYLHRFNLPLFFLGLVLVELVITGFSLWATGRRRLSRPLRDYLIPSFWRNALADLWKPSLIFLGIGFCTVIQNRLDWMLVYAYISKTELAYYALANKIYELFNSYIGVLIHTAFPWMCKAAALNEKSPKLILGFKGIVIIGLLLAGLSAFLVPHMLTIIFGDKYTPSNQLIFLFMIIACLAPAGSFMYYLITSFYGEKYLFIVSAIGVGCQVFFDFLLIPKFGALGATLAMGISISIIFLLFNIIIYNYYEKYSDITKNISIFIIISILVLFSLRYLISLSSLINVLIYVCFVASYSIFVFIDQDEKVEILSYVHKIKSSFSAGRP